MRKYKVYINGQLVPAEKASISVFDGAFLYGEGLFETLLAGRGKIPFLKDHLRRLRRGVKALGIPLGQSDQQLTAVIHKTLRSNKLEDAYIRISVSAEEADVGKRRRSARDTHIVIFAKPPDPYPAKLYRQGARLIVIKDLLNDPVGVATIKTTNYLVKVMGRRQVQQRKADEGILLNGRGQITECTSSNIFMLKTGRLYTPPVSIGLIPGVIRKQVLQLARRLKVPVREQAFNLSKLEKADEIFITSTLKGIMPVSHLAGKRVGTSAPGLVTNRLMAAYSKRLGINSAR